MNELVQVNSILWYEINGDNQERIKGMVIILVTIIVGLDVIVLMMQLLLTDNLNQSTQHEKRLECVIDKF